MGSSIIKEHFGNLSTGEAVYCYTLVSDSGIKVKISDFGATIIELYCKDKHGCYADVVAGYDNVNSYEFGDGYLGATIGRVGNRIAKGCFTLDGMTYDGLYLNDGANHLHGGKCGFSHKLWCAEPIEADEPSLVMTYTSEDGEEGYPGKLSVAVTFKLTADGGLAINYKASTDKPTILNLTNHSYFNLGGYDSGSVLDHILWMDADRYLPTYNDLIPTGEMRSVFGTPFDFTKEKNIGREMDYSICEDLMIAGGYDHCMCFAETKEKEGIIPLRVVVYEAKSGREMKVYTDMPCVQLYTANFLSNKEYPLKKGYPQSKQTALCLETQCMPDSINHEGFTNTILSPGEKYDHTTIYKFGIR